MAKTQFRLSRLYLERAKIGVARTQPHRQLSVGLRLLEAAERESGADARREEHREIRIDGEAGIGAGESPPRAAAHAQIEPLYVISPDIVRRESNRPISLPERLGFIVCSGIAPSVDKVGIVGEGAPGEGVGVFGVNLERAFEQGPRLSVR